MSVPRLLAAFALLPLIVTIGSPVDDIRDQVPSAVASLNAFHGELPANLDRKLHVVYWTPSDREPQPQWRERLSRTMEATADYYESELKRIGTPARRLPLDHEADGLLKIHLVKGAQPYSHYEVGSGAEIRGECLPTLRAAGISADKETIVIFCNMSTWDPEKRTMRQNSPYYAGGNARNGTAWQVDSALLDPKLLTEKGEKIHDGQYGHISLGRYNSIFVGGVVHELGHALGLPHNRERPDEAALFGTALMGSGNRTYGEDLRGESKGSFLTLAHALRLASHPLFTGSNKGLAERSRAEFVDLAVRTEGQSIVVTGSVKGSPPVYAIAGYSDPEGGGDYDASTASAAADWGGMFRLTFNALRNGKAGELRLVAMHANGLTTPRSALGYEVADDGAIDITSLQARLLLDPIAARLHTSEAAELIATLPPASESEGARLAHVIAKRFSLGKPAQDTAPTEAAENMKELSLSDAKPLEQKVGWRQPSTDRLPEEPYILAAGGKLFERGIYAHAPARHSYALGGKWARLTGTAGLADGHAGKVVFVIKGDGKELWRSRNAEAGALHRYDVPVAGVSELELLVEDGGNGTGGDWGLWIEATLAR